MKKKFGCLTWWRNNYGSVLQAYALQSEINSIENIECEIICQYGKKIASASNFKDKLKRFGIKKTVERVFWKFCVPKLRQRSVAVQDFVDKHLKISSIEFTEDRIAETNKYYNGFVCGSDQVWNLGLVSLDSMYWLGFADNDKIKIAYAPSIGVEVADEEQKLKICENLKEFKAISCREQSGTDLINNSLKDNRCTTVLDPTMLVERGFWDKICPARKFQEPYIFVYMLRGTKSQRQFIEKFAKIKGLKIVTMPFLDTEKIELYDLKFGDIKYWNANPIEFISVIRYAEYVFTDSFHSTVFSCLYHKEFYIFPKIGNAQASRLTSLQEMFEIPNRIIADDTTVKEILEKKEINWKRVDEILCEKRLKSKEYLTNAFNI